MNRELAYCEQFISTPDIKCANPEHRASAVHLDAVHRYAVAKPVVHFLVGVDDGLGAIRG